MWTATQQQRAQTRQEENPKVSELSKSKWASRLSYYVNSMLLKSLKDLVQVACGLIF